MSFSPDKPLAAMIVLAIVGLAWHAAAPASRRADLVVLLFDESHAIRFRGGDARTHDPRSPVGRFEREMGLSVDVRVASSRAVDLELLSRSADGPDIVAIEIGSAGKVLRGPAEAVPLVPLDDWLDRKNLRSQFLAARLAAWSHAGRTFGLPLDVHPVSLTYRQDLFAAVGLDPASAKTWDDFTAIAREFRSRWHARGVDRHAIALSHRNADSIQMMLLQRGVNTLDEAGVSHLADSITVDTVARYLPFINGDDPIAADTTGGPARLADRLADGTIAALLTPDWQIASLRVHERELAGKLRMIALPRFEPGDAPTSTWGGTMLAIPRSSGHAEQAKRLLRTMLIDPATRDDDTTTLSEDAKTNDRDAARRSSAGVDATLPATPADWPTSAGVDPLFSDDPAVAVYRRLAPSLPRRIVSPYAAVASGALAAVLGEGTSRPTVDRAELRNLLARADAEIAKRVRFAERP